MFYNLGPDIEWVAEIRFLEQNLSLHMRFLYLMHMCNVTLYVSMLLSNWASAITLSSSLSILLDKVQTAGMCTLICGAPTSTPVIPDHL